MVHTLQSVTDLDLDTTITSIDRVEACDLISRNAMLEGLQMDGGDQIIPFVSMFYGGPPHTYGKTRWAPHSTSHKRRRGAK